MKGRFYENLLRAYCRLLGLEFEAMPVETPVDGLVVSVYAKTGFGESALDVFEYGKAACVSSMREYKPGAGPGDTERMCRRILEGTFGGNRYILSMKPIVVERKDGVNYVRRLLIAGIPASAEELYVRLAAAGQGNILKI